MPEGILAEGIEDLNDLETISGQHGYPLELHTEFGLEPFSVTVRDATGLTEAFTEAQRRSPTRTIMVRRP